MSITETKKRLGQLPDGDILTASPNVNSQTVVVALYDGKILTSADLQALADSHDELLAAAEAAFGELHILRTLKDIQTTACDELEAAIAKAGEV